MQAGVNIIFVVVMIAIALHMILLATMFVAEFAHRNAKQHIGIYMLSLFQKFEIEYHCIMLAMVQVLSL